MTNKYVLYCDESDRIGQYYGNFFGGVILREQRRMAIEDSLDDKKRSLNLGKELKWQRVTENYADKYIEFIDFFFTHIESGDLKFRAMFTQNIYQPTGLTREQLDNSYFHLYYQFIKHAFGLRQYSLANRIPAELHLLFDTLPDTKVKCDKFKEFVASIPRTSGMANCKVTIPLHQIAEVDSSEHVILQGLDIILGAICFRLNDKHLAKMPETGRRGKRTIAKERVYKFINKRIRDVRPNFNIGATTGLVNGPVDRWAQPYRHWLFKPKNHNYVKENGKYWAPAEPT